MPINFLLLLFGFYILYKGAHWLVNGASRLADRLGISKVVVGVTMVAFGTSAPELFVNMIAAARGKTEFALSNVSGSNLTNLCIGFGVCSLIGTVVIKRKQFLFDLCLFCISPAIILFFIGIYPGGFIPLWAVIFLVVPFGFYLHSLKGRLFEQDKTNTAENVWKCLGMFFIGIATLYIAGEVVLKTAINIGSSFGLSDSIMGFTIVAFGTSIPDVAASIIALKKGEGLIAAGNLIGSNIFNILLVLPATLLVSFKGLNAQDGILTDYIIVFLSSFLFVLVVLVKQKIGKFLGVFLILMYVCYMVYRVMV